MNHEHWMRKALQLATRAAELGEVPVGALVVRDHVLTPAGVWATSEALGDLVAEAHNEKETQGVSTLHAEMLAIERASRALGRWRLQDCTLYVTLEPCVMCAGALVQARLARVVWGAADPKAGAVVSHFRVFDGAGVNHRPQKVAGVLAAEAAGLLTEFFRTRRGQQVP